MEKEKILNELTVILMNSLSVERAEVKPESLIMNDFGADSLDVVEIVMESEKKFGINILDSELKDMEDLTVEKMADIIQEKVI